MAGGERGTNRTAGGSGKARFVRWSIAAYDGQPDVLATLGPVTVNFAVELNTAVTHAEHGLALFNSENQLMWANAAQNLKLKPGLHVFSHSFASLPLRPGSYRWQASLWDGGEMMDQWDAVPEMTIATDVHQHYLDEWNGILNLPSQFVVETPETVRVHANDI